MDSVSPLMTSLQILNAEASSRVLLLDLNKSIVQLLKQFFMTFHEYILKEKIEIQRSLLRNLKRQQ